MAEAIQFPCPACGATLRLPLAMAAIHGPCPSCHEEIIAPDPARGLGARMPEPADSAETVPPPVLESPSEPAPPAPPAPAPDGIQEPTQIHAPLAPPPARSQHGVVLLLSVLLASVLSLAAGYVIGLRFRPPVSLAPVAHTPPASPPAPVAPVIPEPTKPVVETPPVSETPPPPERTPEPVKASAAAEAALKAFLDAPDWSTRAAHALAPEKVRSAMEAYSHKAPDGPTAFRSVSIQNSYTDKATGNTLFIFQVVTEAQTSGFPVAVVETESGWQVDWRAFIEFRDDLFKSFADGPAGETGRFHVIVSTPPAARASKTENEHFSSFLLDPPMPGRQRLAYVRKTSAIHDTLAAATANGAVFTPVLELAKQKAPDGKTYLEITGIAASDWLPEDR